MRFRKSYGNIASHDVWQIQRDGPLSEVAEESEGFGEGFDRAHRLGTALLVDLIVKFTTVEVSGTCYDHFMLIHARFGCD
jgi:hypothetical protein